MLQYLAFIPVFGVLVTIHELGHFIVAKLNGVHVLEFSIGFGTPVLQVDRGETVYSLRLVPLGGYVRMAGMDDGEIGPRSFNEQPVASRLAIIAAGALMNLMLPVLILTLALAGTAGSPVRIQALTPGAPAQAAGLQRGDAILAVDGRRPQTPEDLAAIIGGSAGRALSLDIERPGRGDFTLVIQPRLLQPDGAPTAAWRIGVAPEGSLDLAAGIRGALQNYVEMVGGTLGGFRDLLTGHIPHGLAQCGPSGPVGIVRATGEAASAGLAPLLFFAAFLSLNLGILNLLPIPALDGGRLLFLVIELVRGRPLDPRFEQRVHYIGLVVLISLIVLISFNDVLNLGTPFKDLVNRCSP